MRLPCKLKAAQDDLFVAVKLSEQGAYHRRAPSPVSLPHYQEVKRLLYEVLGCDSNNIAALLMLAQASEGLMEFKEARQYLERAFEAGQPRTKKLLKKLALLRENTKQWKDLVLTPDMLRELGEYLESMGVGAANRSLDFTREWLSSNFDGDPEQVIAALDERGAFSDFQVLANVVNG